VERAAAELAINLKTAKALLGLEIPPTLLSAMCAFP
jgi:hypothetical protein